MGSYLTIVNDTSDNWQCKVGPDSSALKWATISVAVLAAFVGTIVTLGAIAPLVATVTASGVYTIFNVPLAALTATTIAASSVSTIASTVGFASGTSIVLAQAINKHISSKGYITIKAGEKRRFGRMTLSLWQQSACIKTTMIGPTIELDTLYMRPIFSGPTMNSNIDHSIQWWITKRGTTKETIQSSSEQPPINMRT